jgi:hypothetical protein
MASDPKKTPHLTAAAAGLDSRTYRVVDLGPLITRALAAVEAMSPVDRALHDADQRRSFVRGMGKDPGPDVLAEEVRRLRALVVQLGGDPHAE